MSNVKRDTLTIFDRPSLLILAEFGRVARCYWKLPS